MALDCICYHDRRSHENGYELSDNKVSNCTICVCKKYTSSKFNNKTHTEKTFAVFVMLLIGAVVFFYSFEFNFVIALGFGILSGFLLNHTYKREKNKSILRT